MDELAFGRALLWSKGPSIHWWEYLQWQQPGNFRKKSLWSDLLPSHLVTGWSPVHSLLITSLALHFIQKRSQQTLPFVDTMWFRWSKPKNEFDFVNPTCELDTELATILVQSFGKVTRIENCFWWLTLILIMTCANVTDWGLFYNRGIYIIHKLTTVWSKCISNWV